jgi:hypothetical protein
LVRFHRKMRGRHSSGVSSGIGSSVVVLVDIGVQQRGSYILTFAGVGVTSFARRLFPGRRFPGKGSGTHIHSEAAYTYISGPQQDFNKDLLPWGVK